MNGDLLAKTKKGFHFDILFWKKFTLIAIEFLSLFFISFFYLNLLEKTFTPSVWLLLLVSLIAWLFFFIFITRSLVSQPFSLVFYFSLLDVIALFLPFIFDPNLIFVKTRLELIQKFWLYFLITAFLLLFFFFLADLRVKREVGFFKKMSWRRVSKPGLTYLCITLSVFLTFSLLIYNSISPGLLFSLTSDTVLKTSQPLVRIFYPDFSFQMTINDFSKLVYKKEKGEELAFAFSQAFHQRFSPSSKLVDVFSLYLRNQSKSLEGNKGFILALFLTVLGLFLVVLKFLAYFVNLFGRIFLEILIALNFLHRSWVQTTKEKISF